MIKTISIPPKGSTVFSPTLFVANGSYFKKISVEDILYLKAAKDYTMVITSSEKYLSSLGISYLEEKLDPWIFKRVHRSFIVNLSHVSELHKEFGKTYLVMKNGLELNVGRCYGSNLKQLLI